MIDALLNAQGPRRLLLLIAGALAAIAFAGPAAAQSWCSPGAHINAQSYGHWYAATVIRPAGGGKCLIHYDQFSSSSDEAIGPDLAAPAGQTTSFAAGGGRAQPAQAAHGYAGGVKAGHYHCTFFAQGTLTTVPGFTILGGRYRHDNGGGGAVSLSGGVISFSGGPLDRQAGKVEPGIVRLFNERRSRTVIDCENR